MTPCSVDAAPNWSYSVILCHYCISMICLHPQVSDGKVQMDILLPNGMFIQLDVDFNRPLDLLKKVTLTLPHTSQRQLWLSGRAFALWAGGHGFDPDHVIPKTGFSFLSKLVKNERDSIWNERLREIIISCDNLTLTIYLLRNQT